MGNFNFKIANIINKLKISIRNHNAIVNYKNNEIISGFFECLWREGLIFGILKEKDDSTTIIINYNDNGISPIKKIKNEYKNPFLKSYSLKYMLHSNFLKKVLITKGSESSVLILLTTKGILTHKEAVREGIGGICLMSIIYS